MSEEASRVGSLSAKRLKELRRALGLTQQEFAARIGVSVKTLTGQESGHKVLSRAVVRKICNTFGVNERWLRMGEAPMFVLAEEDKDLQAAIACVATGEGPELSRRFRALFAALSPRQWDSLVNDAAKLFRRALTAPAGSSLTEDKRAAFSCACAAEENQGGNERKALVMEERLKELRKTLGLTQKEFASRVGCSENAVARYESGNRNPSELTVSSICKAFGVREDWLRNGTGPMLCASGGENQAEAESAKVGETMGDRLKRIRLTLGMTQQEISDKLGIKSSGRGGLWSNYETNVRSPSAMAIKNICTTLHIEEEWLRTGKGPMSRLPDADPCIQAAVDCTMAGEPEDILRSLGKLFSILDRRYWVIVLEKAFEIVTASGDPAGEGAESPMKSEELARIRAEIDRLKADFSEAENRKIQALVSAVEEGLAAPGAVG